LIVVRLSLRGVAHNDLGRHNILLADDGRVFVIDFDRATQCSPVAALYRNFFRRLGSRGPIANIRSLFQYVFRTRRARPKATSEK
ncbi:MAG: hypothetical protein JJU36_06545, partial [Phycisphaeraceae bacterium]|nr:hypothetical protein [Phycisphaeraceae bacterium]